MIARPFIKWVGGKRQLLPELTARAPASFGTYYEPFLGGAALFFHMRPQRAVLSDVNERLVRTYRAVRDDVEEVIGLLRMYPYEREFYDRTRAINIDARSDVEVAAWFIYLNKAGFNGLYRVNKLGRFNVPFGRYTNPTICDADNLRACSEALQGTVLRCDDFRDATRSAEAGDFVYLDCPYVPLSATSSFASYTADGFGREDQARLRNHARAMKDRGVHVLLSNSSAPLVRDLYSDGFTVEDVDARRAVNSKASARGAIKEVVIR